MKSILKPLILVLVLNISFGCKTQNHPLDFGFKVESKTETINSFDSIYTRSYQQGDSTVKIQFNSIELNRIYNSIKKNDLDAYPDNYSPACEIYKMPSFETKLQFRINGEYKNLTYKHDCRFPLISGYFKNRKYSKINKSIQVIEKIVSSKPEVILLSDTNWIFY